MNSTGKILQQFRLNRGMTRQELSNGIISRQTYSKIENDKIEPNFEILNAILNKLDYSLSDFAIEYERLKEDNIFFYIYQKGIANEATEEEIIRLVNYVEQNYKRSKKDFYLYGLTKGQLFPYYPELIPKFNSEDKEYFKRIMMVDQSFFSLYDLKIIGNFASHLLDYKSLLYLYSSLPEFFPFDYGDNVELYHAEIHRIYNNFCDIAIYNNDTNTARSILDKHKAFAKTHKNIRNGLYIQINELTIKFKESKDDKYIFRLKSLSEGLNLIGDYETAKALDYQIKVLETDDEYISFNAITHN